MPKFSKGVKIHRSKKSANKIAGHCRAINMKYRIRKLKKGYRVDKDWS